jgi:hypothetical protein
MPAERVGDMTLEELKGLIQHEVNERISGLMKPQNRRSPQEVLESIRKHRFTPPPGSKSTGELLREDRNR